MERVSSLALAPFADRAGVIALALGRVRRSWAAWRRPAWSRCPARG